MINVLFFVYVAAVQYIYRTAAKHVCFVETLTFVYRISKHIRGPICLESVEMAVHRIGTASLCALLLCLALASATLDVESLPGTTLTSVLQR